ncbi:site-2 protease family protein [Halomicrobium salinisoli]|uniref:site-2 protease family protein n=1 Tax=Halomicrobium salinisoli TaxID=2878391 RepID=UPI001CF00FEE|nr:site-2 protease family protein [Halomicrobium salinisoli]
MVSALTWVLAGIVAYTLVGMALRARGLLPDYVRLSGPITTLHTGRGRALLNKLAARRRFWRAWGNLGVGIALVVMVGSFLLVVVGAYSAIVDPQPTQLNQPRNVLAIPGVNDFLPLSVAPEIITGLVLGLIVHEGGHGLLCRVEDIEIDSLGLAFFTLIPVGAFVEPDEEELRESSRGSQLRMFAAGVTNNFALSLIALAVLFGPVMGAFAVVDGAPVGGVVPGSAADQAGIDRGDVLTGVDGQRVASTADLDAALANTSERTIAVNRREGEPVSVERSLVVTSAAAGAPLDINATVTAVDGTEVYTERGFERAARNATVATLRTDGGETVTTPLGASVLVAEDGPLAAEGAPAGESLVITAVGDRRTVAATDLTDAVASQSPGEPVTVVGFVDGERQRYEVTPAETDAGGLTLGIASIERGTSGFVVDEFGIKDYPAGSFLEILGGDAEDTATGSLSFAQRVFFVLLLPFAGAGAAGIDFNFAGFTGIATNFYEVEGALGAFGTEPAFLFANLLFWAGWINLVIGQFNCVPTFPLDGGHLLRASTESVVSRLPLPDKRRVVTTVSVTVTLVMIGSLLGMVFLPQLLT